MHVHAHSVPYAQELGFNLPDTNVWLGKASWSWQAQTHQTHTERCINQKPCSVKNRTLKKKRERAEPSSRILLQVIRRAVQMRAKESMYLSSKARERNRQDKQWICVDVFLWWKHFIRWFSNFILNKILGREWITEIYHHSHFIPYGNQVQEDYVTLPP